MRPRSSAFAAAGGAAVSACGLVLAALAPSFARAEDALLSPSDVEQLSIEDLAKLEISSVSKTPEPLSDAAASIYVITHEDIIRSGAESLPDMLRLAPNLQVAQITANNFAISARGFNSAAADKLLVLIDGRSVYTPFFNGVFWDAQRVLPDDIDRIEVISGPGAALWGANAVNGVINIVTRKASETPGFLAEVGGGGLERRLNLQYGAQLRPDLAVRGYAMGAQHGDDITASGVNAKDGWNNGQLGFRLDWTPGHDQLTLQGDLYRGLEQQNFEPNQSVGGENLLLRWTRQGAGGSSLQVQAYVDDLWRHVPTVANDSLLTYDLDIQDAFVWGRQQIVWGGGVRAEKDDFLVVPGNMSSPLTQFFDPASRTLIVADGFGQDTVSVTSRIKVILGLKLEDDPYVGFNPLPSLRVSWKPSDSDLLWAAVSRAVRAPSRLDRDFFETSGPIVVLKGGIFESEDLIAYEAGYRTQPTARFSASVSLYYNDYNDLRSFEYAPGPSLPVTIENRMEGDTYGVEAWGNYQAADWWRLSAGFDRPHKNLHYELGGSGIGGLAVAGDDPAYQASLRSSMDLPRGLALDADLRGVGALPDPHSPAYVELNGRLAWSVTRSLELSLVGDNLLHAHHLEFGSTMSPVQLGAVGVETGRSILICARWRP